MATRQFLILYHDDQFAIDVDTKPDDGFQLLKFQIFSLTSIPPDDQKILVEDGGIEVTEQSDLNSVPEKLRLVSIQEEDDGEKAKADAIAKSDEEFARMLQAEEEAIMFRQYMVIDNGQEFRQRVEPYVQQVLMYEDYDRQEAARKSVPIEELEEKALVSLAKEGNFKPSKAEKDHSFLLQLLFWFKQSFSWVNSPPCENCGCQTSNIGMGNPLPSEIRFGASRVELYRCNMCSSVTRFPRYNDPLKLVETKKGRCGEWANCFTLYCRAFGYESRLILDFTDHVWTECYSSSLGRWMHLDPCEGVYDNPLLYEKGWNKKLNYVIAISKDGVADVTKRYTRKWHEVLTRRNITTEATVSSVLSSITKNRRSRYPSDVCARLESRDRSEAEELDRDHLQIDASVSLPGRQSGAVEWRKARDELGNIESSPFASSSCPKRKCVDDHVTRIYDAYSFLCTQFLKDGQSAAKAVEVLEMLRRLLLDLQAAPFKNRKAFYDPNASYSSDTMAIPISRLLSAISLKQDLEENRMCVSLAADPIQTSIALPVALDAVNELIDDLKCNKVLQRDTLFPRENRVSCASVLASGEQLPFGIATSAFDGLLATKWEEPDGAKGCWLIYKVTDDKMYELESYDLISANDAPERDPMDWILEGSQDGGKTWTVLDKRSSQFWDKRFQRKMYAVQKASMANEFRFRFLAVKDANGNSRFQIGGINLYAKGN